MAADFSILTNRKRAVIALVHSILFLLLASRDLAFQSRLGGVVYRDPVPVGAFLLVGIYFIVSSILLYLFGRSISLTEKLYFGFCSASATSGLIRAILGDAAFPAGAYLRVGMLLAAVATGFVLWKAHVSSITAPVAEMGD